MPQMGMTRRSDVDPVFVPYSFYSIDYIAFTLDDAPVIRGTMRLLKEGHVSLKQEKIDPNDDDLSSALMPAVFSAAV
ncbi:hypothetical protein VM1G_11290 [Cytospora mali]|uniref:Uncharacterized protein n=1 Tax=Cytospora mali TaxID=578113 RepID=A0A194VKI8_CYTMA|nr:hypothetical protein VM1G_11290 [Valsa mali]